MTVSGAAFSAGMGDMWFQRRNGAWRRAARPMPAEAVQYPVWLGQVMESACFLRRLGYGRRRDHDSPQAIPRTAEMPNRSEPMSKDTVKKRVPGSGSNRAPALRCNIIEFAPKNNAPDDF